VTYFLLELFPQLDHQKRVIAKSMKKKKRRDGSPTQSEKDYAITKNRLNDRVPKAYRLDKYNSDSSDESLQAVSDDDESFGDKSDEDSGLDSDTESTSSKLNNVQVSSLLSDMERLKEDLIRRNEYEKLKEKFRRCDSDEEQ
jgi:hypothetical protein